MLRKARPLVMTADARQLLERWIRAGSTPQRVAKRARIVLLAADGKSNRAIAKALRISVRTVSLWRRRYEAGGPASLLRDAPGRGRAARVTAGESADRIRALIDAADVDGAQWTIRRLADATGISRASVHRILRAYGRGDRRPRRGTHQ